MIANSFSHPIDSDHGEWARQTDRLSNGFSWCPQRSRLGGIAYPPPVNGDVGESTLSRGSRSSLAERSRDAVDPEQIQAFLDTLLYTEEAFLIDEIRSSEAVDQRAAAGPQR